MDAAEIWQELKDTLKELSKQHNQLIGIGSGGNINKLFSIIGSKNSNSLSSEAIGTIYKEMQSLTVEERMLKYAIKKDRAEVILPALTIYNNILKWANITEINVPKIGLADGLIRHLYDTILKEK